MYGTRAATNKPTPGQLDDPHWAALPRYWIAADEVAPRIPSFWTRQWLIGFRNAISAVADARSVTFAIFPLAAVGNSLPLLYTEKSPAPVWLLVTNFNTFVLDYVAKQKASGGNLNFYIVKQLPMLPAAAYSRRPGWLSEGETLTGWIGARVLELTYTAWDLAPLAADLGWSGAPFRWDEERRFLMRCELDAAFFHLYLGPDSEWNQQSQALTQLFPTVRDVVSYVMDSFPIVRRKDEERFNGDYRSKHKVLEMFDAMAASLRSGLPYRSPLDPPPSDPSCCHPPERDTVTA